MKSYTLKTNSQKLTEKNSLWDAFITHLESVYFSGASELLDKQLVAFEYEIFRDIYSD